MNEQQNLIASMAVLLILLVVFGLYKPYLKQIFFTSPKNNPSIASGVVDFSGELAGNTLQTVTGGAIGPNGSLYGYGPNSNKWAPF